MYVRRPMKSANEGSAIVSPGGDLLGGFIGEVEHVCLHKLIELLLAGLVVQLNCHSHFLFVIRQLPGVPLEEPA